MPGPAIGYGSTIEVADPATPNAYTAIASVAEVSPPPIKVDSVDVTTMQSPGGYREQIPGLKSLEKMGFKINWDPASATDIFLQGIIGLNKIFRVTFQNGQQWKFTGFLTGFTPAVPLADRITCQIEIEATSQLSQTAAAVPVNSVLPAVSGSLVNGSTLTAYEGVWTNAPTSYAYQWKKGGVNIGGATNKTYATVAGDVGGIITVTVTPSNSAGAGAPATSSNLGPIT